MTSSSTGGSGVVLVQDATSDEDSEELFLVHQVHSLYDRGPPRWTRTTPAAPSGARQEQRDDQGDHPLRSSCMFDQLHRYNNQEEHDPQTRYRRHHDASSSADEQNDEDDHHIYSRDYEQYHLYDRDRIDAEGLVGVCDYLGDYLGQEEHQEDGATPGGRAGCVGSQTPTWQKGRACPSAAWKNGYLLRLHLTSHIFLCWRAFRCPFALPTLTSVGPQKV
ncbi:unnamed protein product [Amoebophrya sp. A25]|nr:unnamed protein product [Amoebophrya sp. A25]|eukprot:GSA25T00015184001.1